jgi:hypothetical protein
MRWGSGILAVVLVAGAGGTAVALDRAYPPPLAATVTTPTCHARGDAQQFPDPVCTPGAVDPAVTQANLATTICRPGYTEEVRRKQAPSSYTSPLKVRQMTWYGFTDSPGDHEEDHLIPLQLGGAARDPANLWPEPDASPNPKDTVENRLKAAVCNGTVTLAAAQTAIVLDWSRAFDLIASWCPTPVFQDPTPIG